MKKAMSRKMHTRCCLEIVFRRIMTGIDSMKSKAMEEKAE